MLPSRRFPLGPLERLKSWEGFLLVILLAIIIVNSIRAPAYLSIGNQMNLFILSIEKIIVVLVMTFIIINAEIDLSVASMMGLSACTLGWLHEQGAPIWVAFLVGLVIGVLGGAFNGFWIAVVGLPSLVVTLAMLIGYRGLAPELMMTWFDRYADWLGDLVDSCIDAGVDIITLSDDWGSNRNMLFSPRMWRRMIAPYAARVVKRATGRGVPVNLHSDGYILNIMDDLIEMGYSMLHPVQESAGMDPRHIKETYGDKLVIYGSLDVVDGLYTHRDEALDNYITGRFEIYGPGGGFIFNTGHFVQPDIPPRRLVRAYTLANELAPKYHG